MLAPDRFPCLVAKEYNYSKTYVDKSGANRHGKDYIREKYNCPDYSKTLVYEASMLKYAKVYNEDKVKCPDYDRTFVYRRNIAMYYRDSYGYDPALERHE